MEKLKQGYKQTDIGLIPEDWEIKPIREVLRIKHGKDQKGIQSLSGTYPILGTGGLMGYANKFLYNQESVLIGRKGTIDKPQYMNSPFWTVDTLFYSEIKKNQSAKFLYYKFLMIDWYAYNEASGVPSLNSKTIENIEIGCPTSLAEQTAIANFLSDVDNLISALDKKITKKQQIKQGAMQQLLTGKKRLPGFSGEWKNVVLSDIVDDFIVPMRDKPKNLKGNIPWCRIEDFNGMYLLGSQSEQGVDIETIKSMNLKIYPIGTLLVSCSAYLGRCAIVGKELVTNQTFIGLVPSKKCNVEFLYYAMKREEKSLNSLSSGTTISYLSREQFESYPLFIPSKSEQTAIAQVLTDMDNEISQLEADRNKNEQIKAGMMQQLLTGKIRLVN